MLSSSIARAILGMAAGVAGVVGYSHLIEPFWLEVTRREVALPTLPRPLDGLVVAQLSDFHLRPGAGPNDALDQAIRFCNQARPDLVVLTGDYLGERRGLAELPRALGQLQVRPAYAVLGNHDYRFGPKHRRAIEGYFSDAGIELLDNRTAVFERDRARLWIVGVGDGLTSHDRLEEATRGLGERDRPRILLTHYPDLLLDLPTENVDLALAGHSHGAQIHLPFLARFALQRSWTVFDRGFFDVAGVPLYVNRGLGTSGRQIRLFARPELTLLTLRTGRRAPCRG
ncbi:MAG: metallophosphoesterase [Chloroflexota bacterium]